MYSLVEKITYTELQQYKMERWKNQNKATNLDEVINFINETESRDKYALQTSKRLRQKHIELDVSKWRNCGLKGMIGE